MTLHLATWLCLGATLAGCALSPPLLPERAHMQDFALSGRFALRVPEGGQNSGGRMNWEHRGPQDRLLLASPIGVGVAEIEMRPGLSTLRLANGETQSSDDPEALIEAATGQRLPVARLSGWLLGRADADSTLRLDSTGRPLQLDEAGWRIDYAYDDEAPGALPARLTLDNHQGIILKLRIEEWKEAP